MNKLLSGLLLPVGLSLSIPALSHEAGDMFIRAGMAQVAPNEDSSALTLNGTQLEDLGLNLPRSELSLDSDTQIGLTWTYMLSANWAVEVLAATPFQHKATVDGLNVDGATFKHLPPTVSLQYYPLDSSSAIQPYIGLGLNYTLMMDEKISSELDTALAGLGATGGADLKLDDSFGLAAQIGVDYVLNDNWMLNAGLWWIDINTDATIDVPGLGEIKADVDVDPLTYMVSLGYRFR